MKLRHIILLLGCFVVTPTTQAQFLKKLKKKAEQAVERTVLNKTDEKISKKTGKTIDDVTDGKDKDKKDKVTDKTGDTNSALKINTKAKQNMYREDMVIKLQENNQVNQTQYFDADAVAVKLDQPSMPDPGYIDSEGFMYVSEDGSYTKTGLVAVQSQGLMAPTMMLEAYKLPPEPFMANFQKQTDLGLTPNPFNGIVEFAFIYEPEHFRYEDFKESQQTMRGETYTKFEFLNEPGYEGSYVLFDSEGRLLEIYTNKSETTAANNQSFMSRMPPGESLLMYEYKPVTVELPPAIEKKVAGQGLMEMMMGSHKSKKDPNDIDEDDYDTSDSKGMTKSARTALNNHKVTVDMLPASYDFDWKLKTEMVMNSKKKETMDMTFLIKEGATYQGTQMYMEDMGSDGKTTMLFDMELKTMIMFMDMQGQKLLQMYPIPEPRKTTEKLDYKITELPNKTILGYDCKGLQLEDDRYMFQVYHATNAPISLSNFMSFSGAKNMDLPDIDPKIIEQFSNGLVLEMQMMDKKKSKNNVSIIAKSLDKTPTSVKKGAYKEMSFLSGLKN
ncbi:MAG: hypothetical protein GYB32_11965 [Algicola sp.]|nr:hypothetical protein [Algicola sp.]